MKKLTMLCMVLLAPFFIQAQQCDSINNHMVEGYSIQPQGAIQLTDGSILVRVWQDVLDNTGFPQPSFVTYYKIARYDAVILDSVTVDNPEWNDILMAQIHDDGNPAYQKYHNVLVKYFIDYEIYTTNLNLSFFDDDVHFNEALEVTVPLADTIVNFGIGVSTALLDSNNDLILQYSIPSRQEIHFNRFGLDGTLKHSAVIPKTVMPIYDYLTWEGFPVNELKQCSESPLRYNLYGTFNRYMVSFNDQGDFVSYDLDADFNIINTLVLPLTDPNTYPFVHNVPYFNGLEYLNDGSLLIARDCRWDDNLQSTGILKYDADGNVVGGVWFDSSEVLITGYGGIAFDAYKGIDLKKDGQGNIYYAFQGIIDNWKVVAIIKLDEDLNILWERYGMHLEYPGTTNRYADIGLNLLDQGGVTVIGYTSGFSGSMYSSGLWMMRVDDDGVGVSEIGNAVKPYVFSPNPVENQIHIHYSPDVKPSIVELYDIQGRLLRTQSDSLETVSVEQLPSGTYTLRVVMADGTAYSDKVVKQ